MSNVITLNSREIVHEKSPRIGEDMNTQPYMSPLQTCEYLDGAVTTRQLQRWRDEGRGPRFAKLGKSVVYRRADIDAWVAASLIGTRDQS